MTIHKSFRDYINLIETAQQSMAEGLGKDIKRLATGKDVKSRAGQEIAKSQDASMKGDNKTSKKHFDRYDKLDKLANREQSMAEMDSSGPKGRMKSDGTRSHSTYGSRDHYSDADPQSTAKPVTVKDFVKNATKILTKHSSKTKGVADDGRKQ